MKARVWSVLVAVALCAGAAYGVAETYAPVRVSTGAAATAPAACRSALSSDDSATTVAPIDPQVSSRGIEPDPTVCVAPRFSASGATALIEVWLYHKSGSTYTLLGVSARQTATASTTLRDGASGNYLLQSPLFFDTCGATAYDVRVRTISTGTVDLWAWTVGGGSGSAE